MEHSINNKNLKEEEGEKTVRQTETKIKWRSRQNNCIEIWEKENNINGNETIVLASAKRLITFHLEWLDLLLATCCFFLFICLRIQHLFTVLYTSFTFAGPLCTWISWILLQCIVYSVYGVHNAPLATFSQVYIYMCLCVCLNCCHWFWATCFSFFFSLKKSGIKISHAFICPESK